MDYPIEPRPFDIIPSEMNKKQVEEYFQWFIKMKESRIQQLQQYVNNHSERQIILDFTPDSLITLWEWFEDRIEWEEKMESEIQAELKMAPEWMHEYILADTKKVTILTLALQDDISIYFGETLIHNHPSIRWGYRMKPKRLDGVNLPILLGFRGNMSINQRSLVSVCVVNSTKTRNRYELYETYKIWSGHVE